MDKKTRDELILRYAPLVKNIVGRMVMKLPLDFSDREELINVGIIGLMSALDKFDANRSVRFETYAGYRIRGAVLDELRARDWLPRSARAMDSRLEEAYATLHKKFGRSPDELEIAEHIGLSLDEYYRHLDGARATSVISYEDISPDFLDVYAARDVLGGIDKGNPFVAFSNREARQLLKDAIDNLPEKERLVLSLYYFEELTLKEIGRVFDLTESRVCQLHSQAILRIRGALRGKL